MTEEGKWAEEQRGRNAARVGEHSAATEDRPAAQETAAGPDRYVAERAWAAVRGPKDPTLEQLRCLRLVDLWLGLHHAPRTIHSAFSAPVFGIELVFGPGTTFSTFDNNTLTRLVFLAHDLAVRAEVGSIRGGTVVRLHARTPGVPSERGHPNLTDAIVASTATDTLERLAEIIEYEGFKRSSHLLLRQDLQEHFAMMDAPEVRAALWRGVSVLTRRRIAGWIRRTRAAILAAATAPSHGGG